MLGRFDARRALCLLCLALAASLSTGVARAADHAHDQTAAATGHSDAAHSEKKGGLSFLQLERYDLGIFTLIVFGLLVLILGKFAWPKISEGLAKREASIHGAIAEAKVDRQAAEQRLIEAKRQLDEAAATARSIVEEARKDADKLRTTEREAGTRDAAAERERAKREIEAAKDVALNDIYRRAVELATTISAKTLSRQITAADHERLLDESLAELKQLAAKA